MSAGSTWIEFSNTGFNVKYTERSNTGKPETCHRALSINPLYAEGQAKHAMYEMPPSVPGLLSSFV